MDRLLGSVAQNSVDTRDGRRLETARILNLHLDDISPVPGLGGSIEFVTGVHPWDLPTVYERFLDSCRTFNDEGVAFDRSSHMPHDGARRPRAAITVCVHVPRAAMCAGAARGEQCEYSSAHIEPVESELVVRSPHSCQSRPHTIEEVRRILRRHVTAPEELRRQKEEGQ